MTDLKLTPEDAGTYVDGWWGHYSTSQALVRAISDLEWPAADEEDRKTILALALTDQYGGSFLVHEDVVREARREAKLPDLEGDDLYEATQADDLFEVLVSALDDAEEWLTENAAPEGFYFGSHPDIGDWGMWADEDDDPANYEAWNNG